jgi:Zn-dependent peptidase ImmA (M78 family)
MPLRSPEREAENLLAELRIRRPPVNVERIARSLGTGLSEVPFDGEISGMLYRDGRQVIIGVNPSHGPSRKRFSIAHELGHLRLHKGRQIIVDRAIRTSDTVRVNFRDETSGQASDREEIQANQFAAALLMPEPFVRRAMLRVSKDAFLLERVLIELAREFDVSREAMEFRLINLGLSSTR